MGAYFRLMATDATWQWPLTEATLRALGCPPPPATGPTLDQLAVLLVRKSARGQMDAAQLLRPALVELVARATSMVIVPLDGDVEQQQQQQDDDEVYAALTWAETCAIAVAHLLPLYPQVLLPSQAFFKNTPPFYERIATANTRQAWLIIAKAAFRLLSTAPDHFRGLWNWASFYRLLGTADQQQDGGDVDYSNDPDMLMALIYAVRCVAVLQNYPTPELLFHLLPEHVRAQASLLCLKDEEELNQHRLRILQADTSANDIVVKVFSSADLSSHTVDMCGVLLSRAGAANAVNGSPATNGPSDRLVLTETTQANLHGLALSLALGSPILLEGVTGAGKTALVEEAARIMGRHDLIKIHLGDQTDGKALLGTYVCSQVPGDFRWQHGLLTRAVIEGRWILIEDIDYAPADVLSVLLPLLETRQLFIPARGEQVRAQQGFQLFATRTTAARHIGTSAIGDSLWTRVKIAPLQSQELVEVVRAAYPTIAAYVDTVLRLFNKAIESRSKHTRPLSARDLFKWCRRVASQVAPGMTNSHVPQVLCEIFLIEAYDCYCALLPDTAARLQMLQSFAQELGLSAEYVVHLWSQHKPQLQRTPTALSIGRASIALRTGDTDSPAIAASSAPFAYTGHTLRNLERVAASVQRAEAVLLVGETGGGKTSLVQHLAERTGQRLSVVNLSQQSESADLLGGFKPIDVLQLATPIMEQFETLFSRTFSRKANQKFLGGIQTSFAKRRWVRWVTMLHNAVEQAMTKLSNKSSSAANEEEQADETGSSSAAAAAAAGTATGRVQRLRLDEPSLIQRWTTFSSQLVQFSSQREQIASNFLFAFAEGLLVKAVQRGQWVLLDEVNLATTEMLESLSGLLESAHGTLVLPERGGDADAVVRRHPDFRIFACMNPATDVGKRDLPPALRSRMTEIYVDEMSNTDDLSDLVRSYLGRVTAGATPWSEIVAFYLHARALAADGTLLDGANVRPHFSLRTLSRALEYTAIVAPVYGWRRALHEGFSMAFLTQLNTASQTLLRTKLDGSVFKGDNVKALLNNVPQRPADEAGVGHELIEQFWILRSTAAAASTGAAVSAAAGYLPKYSLTKSVKANLRSLARVVAARRFPVLIQGPTSAGKTSMIEYLANATGHRFVRINNHEHTDLQEYLGSYVTDATGRLVFQEGVLVEALRKGYWIVLDELNLAPSEVLEALNRLLDDNRELFIPETQQTVHPHPSFMLFATQNPPGVYGGRKTLSRAFRNRFLELHFDDIPQNELATIIEERCTLAKSYAEKFVAVYTDLQSRRQGSRLFAGKHGFITLRDMFRWAGRNPANAAWSYQEIANDGYMMLAERVRNPEEKRTVQDVLEKHFKVRIDVDSLYTFERITATNGTFGPRLVAAMERGELNGIVWTPALCRLFTLVSRCIEFKEPVLLVGETGCGKTSVCQVLSKVLQQTLTIVNCHEHSETADFLGSQRPMRRRGQILADLVHESQVLVGQLVTLSSPPVTESIQRLATAMGLTEDPAKKVSIITDILDQLAPQLSVVTDLLQTELRAKFAHIQELATAAKTLFEWQDGPLIESMRDGNLFLLDEISLADDSVLERLNSVLEPGRLLVLAEKGGDTVEELRGHENFAVLATMNPGGDYGKKELSPALRNRFSEIWVPTISDRTNLLQLVSGQLPQPLQALSSHLIDFLEWYKETSAKRLGVGAVKHIISLRDILSWVRFICATHSTVGVSESYIQGASLVFLDAMDDFGVEEFVLECLAFLRKQLDAQTAGTEQVIQAWQYASSATSFALGPFAIELGTAPLKSPLTFALNAPTTKNNAMRVLRALQLSKPILLEGPPGVGKTTLVQQLAAVAGHQLVRINLSEQTDLSDLFGADLPVEGGQGGEFAWRDGPLLMALRAGHWILLDELNLASQSVLEGLNACLDHRASVYIPEIDLTFQVTAKSRIFGCQNPAKQGGGRKGLPKSFLNRFSHVHVRSLTHADLETIVLAKYTHIDRALLSRLLMFNDRVAEATAPGGPVGRKGAPWEFNLRDIFRWVEVASDHPVNPATPLLTADFTRTLPSVYLSRLRTDKDQQAVWQLYCTTVLGQQQQQQQQLALFPPAPILHVYKNAIIIGDAVVARNTNSLASTTTSTGTSFQLLGSQARALESLASAVQNKWMALLTGPSGSGKTALVRLLAQLTHQPLVEFAVNSSVDTTELLGSFEQVDLARTQKALLQRADWLVSSIVGHCLSVNPPHRVPDLLNLWSVVQQQNDNLSGKIALVRQLDALGHLLDAIEGSYVPQGIASTDSYKTAVAQLRRESASLRDLHEVPMSGRFEWVDGTLLRALETGQWVLMDNVNFCSPSVLDRLNPLLEPNGFLAVSERGLVGGQVRHVYPHPNFRLFLTMDPKYGEISRAMRNRALEIAMLTSDVAAAAAAATAAPSATTTAIPADVTDLATQIGLLNPPWIKTLPVLSSATTTASSSALLSTHVHDALQLLASKGLVYSTVSHILVLFHFRLQQTLAQDPTTASSAMLINWDTRDIVSAAHFVLEQVQRGVAIQQAMTFAVHLVYGPKVCPPMPSIQAVTAVLVASASAVQQQSSNGGGNVNPYDFGRAPWLINDIGSLARHPQVAQVARSSASLVHLSRQADDTFTASASQHFQSNVTAPDRLALSTTFGSMFFRSQPTAVTPSDAHVQQFAAWLAQTVLPKLLPAWPAVLAETVARSLALDLDRWPAFIRARLSVDFTATAASASKLLLLRSALSAHQLDSTTGSSSSLFHQSRAYHLRQWDPTSTPHPALVLLAPFLVHTRDAFVHLVESLLSQLWTTGVPFDPLLLSQLAVAEKVFAHLLQYALGTSVFDVEHVAVHIRELFGAQTLPAMNWPAAVPPAANEQAVHTGLFSTDASLASLADKLHRELALDALASWGALYARGIHPLCWRHEHLAQVAQPLEKLLASPQRHSISPADHRLMVEGLCTLYYLNDITDDGASDSTTSARLFGTVRKTVEQLMSAATAAQPTTLAPSVNALSQLDLSGLLHSHRGLVARLTTSLSQQQQRQQLSAPDLAACQSWLDALLRLNSSNVNVSNLIVGLQRIVWADGSADVLASSWTGLATAWQAALWTSTEFNGQDPASTAVTAANTALVLRLNRPFDAVTLGAAATTLTELIQTKQWLVGSIGSAAPHRDAFTRALDAWHTPVALHPQDESVWISEAVAACCALVLAHGPSPQSLPLALIQNAMNEPEQLAQAVSSAGCEFGTPMSSEMRRKVVAVLHHVGQVHLLQSTNDVSGRVQHLGLAWLAMGQLWLRSYLLPVPVDPTTRTRVKLAQEQREAHHVSSTITIELAQHALEAGISVPNLDQDTVAVLPPLIAKHYARLQDLQAQARQTQRNVVVRPARSLLVQLHQEMNQIGTICDRLTSLADQIVAGQLHGDPLFHQEQMQQQLLQTVASRLVNQYDGYDDLTAPVVWGLYAMKTGLRFVSLAHHTPTPTGAVLLGGLQALSTYPQFSTSVDREAQALSALTDSSSLVLVRDAYRSALVAAKAAATIAANAAETSDGAPTMSPWTLQPHSFIEYMEALLMRAHANLLLSPPSQSSSSSSSSKHSLHLIFVAFADLWQRSEDARAEKERRDNEMYRHKVRTIQILTDDQLDEQAYAAAFPDHTTIFADLVPRDELNDDGPVAAYTAAPDAVLSFNERDDVLALAFSDQDQQLVCDLHARSFLDRRALNDAEKNRMVLAGYNAAARHLEVLNHSALKSLDVSAHGAHVYAASYAIQQIQTSDAPHILAETLSDHKTRSHRKATAATTASDDVPTDALQAQTEQLPILLHASLKYSFYHDSNIAEARQIVPVLENLGAKLRAELVNWPEHAVLQSILTIVDRILGFPLTSPLAQLVTGLELLLKRAQDWEEYASKAMSLNMHLEACSQLIIRWRKLEVQAWPTLLATRGARYAAKTARSWFFLHKLLWSTILQADVAASDDNDMDNAATTAQRLADVTKALDEFMQGATLGSYMARLQLLRAFAADVADVPQAAQLHNILSNLAEFYAQFGPGIAREQAQRRAPLEKELKDVVKLSKWNDLNYFALKQSADKSHRTLGRFLRKYDELLNTPAQQVLTSIRQAPEALLSAKAALSNDQATAAETERDDVDDSLATRSQNRLQALLDSSAELVDRQLVTVTAVSSTTAGAGSGTAALLDRLPTLLRRLKSHTSSSGAASTIVPSGAIVAVDSLASVVIDQVQQFRARDAAALPYTEEKRPVFQALKSQKHRSLGDLLKHLSLVGLSYHRGALTAQHYDTVFIFSQQIPDIRPIAAKPEWQTLVSPLWADASSYHLRTLARLASLRVAAKGAVPDLSRRDIDRGLGFAEHLTHVVMQQRSLLADISSRVAAINTLRFTVDDIATTGLIADSAKVLPLANEQLALLVHVDRIVQQCQTVEIALPAAMLEHHSSALTTSQTALRLVLEQYDGSSDRANVGGSLATAAWTAHQALSHFAMMAAEAHPQASRTDLSLHAIHTLVQGHLVRQQPAIDYVSSLVSLSTPTATASEQSASFDLGGVDQAIETVLLSIQALVHHSTTLFVVAATSAPSTADAMETGNEDEKQTEQEVEKEDLDNEFYNRPNLLVDLHKAFVTIMSDLAIPRVCESAWTAVDRLASSASRRDQVSFAAHGLAQVLASHELAVRRHLLSLLVLHRSCAKLAYVITNLMEVLAQNGFCAPEGVELSADGQGELTMDAEGTGMGEGEGRKDVSKEIEDEEQVLGTRDEEQQNNGENLEKEEDDGLEMSNDFDGQLYDKPPAEDEADKDNNDDDEEEQEMAEEMGETNRSADLLDKHLWDESEDEQDEDEDEDKDGGKDKDTDNRAPTADRPPESETEIKAKDSASDEQKSDPKKKKKDAKKQPQPQPKGGDEDNEADGDDEGQVNEDEPPANDLNDEDNGDKDKRDRQDDAGDDAGDDEGDKDDKDKQQEGAADEAKDDGNQKDKEAEQDEGPESTNPEDQAEEEEEGDGGDQPPDEFPEMDVDENAASNTELDNQPGGEDADDEDNNQEFPENMQLDGEDEDGKRNGAEGLDGDDGEDDDEEGEDGSEPMDMDRPDDMASDGGPRPEQGEESKEIAQGAEDSLSSQGERAPQVATDPTAASKTKPQPLPPKQPDSSSAKQQQQQQQPRRQKVAPQDISGTPQQQSAQREQQQPADDASSSSMTQMPSAADAQAGELEREGTRNGGSDNDQQDASSAKQDQANPHRSLANTLEQWLKRQKQVQEASSASPSSDQQQQQQPPSEPVPIDDPTQTYEHIDPSASDSAGSSNNNKETLTLGAGTEEQVAQQRQALLDDRLSNRIGVDRTDDGSANKKKEDDNMLDEASMLIDADADQAASTATDKPTELRGTNLISSLQQQHGPGQGEDDDQGDDDQMDAGNKGREHEPHEDVDPALEAEKMRQELEERLAQWRTQGEIGQAEAAAVYQQLERVTHDLSQELCESLRLILEPTLASKLRGDYRTGKRLNMKKIIPYVASQFKKDKIWLRRTRPSKRTYQVLIAVDDSHSMADARATRVALETVVLLARALTQLEVGDVGILGFGEAVQMVHPFDQPFSSEAGSDVVRQLRFQQNKTYFGKLVDTSLGLLTDVRQRRGGSGAGGRPSASQWQLEVIVSDGAILDEDRNAVAKLVRKAAEQRVLLVCIAIDTRKQSIMDLQNVEYVGGQMRMTRYMDTFPFEYYVVLRDINTLPAVLSDALRQWFEVLRGLDG